MCTIHWPSAILMEVFDGPLFLAAGGRTVYFGDIGENCGALMSYFDARGAYPAQAVPAE